MIYIVYILYIFFFNKLFFLKSSKLPVFLIVLVDYNFSVLCSISGRGNVNVKYKINNCK